MRRKNSPREGSKIKIADIVFSCVPDDAFPDFALADAYKGFIAEGEPEVILRLHYGETTDDGDCGEKIFDSGSTWRLHRRNGKYYLRVSDGGGNSGPYRIAVLEPDFRSGEVYISGRNHPVVLDPLQYPLAELLMINLLSQGRGSLAHSCGIDNNGKGFLFAGESGAGKSTLCNLWKGEKDVTVLSDDRIIIRKMGGRFWIYGTPWHGDAKVCSPERAPLKKIFFLRHAKKNQIKKMSSIKATSRMIVCSFPTLWDKEGMEFTLGFIDDLVTEVPCYELGFVPDEKIIEFVRNI